LDGDLTLRADEGVAIDLTFPLESDFTIYTSEENNSDGDGMFQELGYANESRLPEQQLFSNDLSGIVDDDLFASNDFEPISVNQADLSPAKDSAPEPIAPTPTSTTQIDTIRVEARQLDGLMGQVGEINVINQQLASRLTDLEALVELWDSVSNDYRYLETYRQQLPLASPIQHHLDRTYQQWAQMGKLVTKFKQLIGGDSSRLDLVTSALESGVKQLRLLPLATIFKLFPRMVRDLAQTQSKQINFAIEGGDLLLDKRLLEEIKDPLMHILRNAIDHGIEPPGERQQQGKQPSATLMIQVRQIGNQTTIEILDDGRGLDLKRIKATAIKRGLYTENQLAAMSDRQIHSLIFAAGFSTRTRVTELSGRGVGLDIVRTNVERLKGSVEVESSPGMGCTFRIQLAHSIGSSQVMMVSVRDRIYALPVEYVERMLLLDKAEIFALGGTPTTRIAGQTMTVAWLADLLQLPAIAPTSPSEIRRTTNSVACLLLQSGQQQLALLVDEIRDRQIVTIEAPHPILKNVPHISGSTILGTGEVCLVLNPIDLFATAAGAIPLPAHRASTANLAPVDTPPSLLLVEDSLVIRTQMQRILHGAGYQVTVANDGLEGWEKLQAGRFDLVISDVEMPRWNGLELTTQIRQHAEYEDLPVVLVTTLAQVADRDRGMQAGANAYLTKGDFDQQLLLDTLTRLI
jgi:two-component system, chemotaxis family, sensor kinase CheA